MMFLFNAEKHTVHTETTRKAATCNTILGARRIRGQTRALLAGGCNTNNQLARST